MAGRSERGNDRRLLGELLLEAGIVSRAGLQEGLREQRLRGGRLGYALLRIGRVTPAAFYLFLQDHLPALSPDLVETIKSAPAVDLIPARLAHHYNIIPVRVEEGVLDLAVASADVPLLIPAIEALTGLRVVPFVCPPALIGEALSQSYAAEVEPGVIHGPCGSGHFVLADRRRGLRPALPETVRADSRPSSWLRAITAEAIRRGARTIDIEPRPGETRVTYRGPLGEEDDLALPRGAYAGLVTLLEGLSGIAARGCVVPREGRFTLTVEGRRIAASILALPGLEGDAYSVDLREERISAPGRDALRAELPDLASVLDRVAVEGKGLLLLAGPGPAEAATGLAAILELLGERLPKRLALGAIGAQPSIVDVAPAADEEAVPTRALLDGMLARSPDILVLPLSARAEGLTVALDLAKERVILAPLAAPDAFEAMERLARGIGPRAAAPDSPLAGILGTRLMERLCRACARPYDLCGLLSPAPSHRRPLPGDYSAAQGCRACRGSGQLRLEPIFEFLPAAGEGRPRPGIVAARLRDARLREGHPTLFQAALRKASSGTVDVREPLRFLLHEVL